MSAFAREYYPSDIAFPLPTIVLLLEQVSAVAFTCAQTRVVVAQVSLARLDSAQRDDDSPTLLWVCTTCAHCID
jgi:hypothetical protein